MKPILKLFLLLLVSSIFYIYTFSGSLHKAKDYTYLKKQKTSNNIDDVAEIKKLAKKWQNLPIQFWYDRRHVKLELNQSCAQFPDLWNIRFIHQYWQEFPTSNGTFKLFGAYLDDRNVTNRIRIITMVDKKEVSMKTHCQLWFEKSDQPTIVPVYSYFYLWHEYWGNPSDGQFRPYLLSCALPTNKSYMVPKAVSLVENPCDKATNSLIVNYQKPSKENPKKQFAVCLKGINFIDDNSIRLIEWMELLRLLGVDKIFFYNIAIHDNIRKLLNYYKDQGFVEMNELTLSQITLDEPFLEHLYLEHESNFQPEVIPYNDCFLKNMYMFDYISVQDVDEVIIPKGNMTKWSELIAKSKKKAISERGTEACSYVARNCYYFNNVTIENVKGLVDSETYAKQLEILEKTPEFLHMLRHPYRSQNCSKPGFYVKSIHDTKHILAVHNHYPFASLRTDSCYYDINFEDGYMHHYRDGCQWEMKEVCYSDYMKDFLFDDTVLRYNDILKNNVIAVLDYLNS